MKVLFARTVIHDSIVFLCNLRVDYVLEVFKVLHKFNLIMLGLLAYNLPKAFNFVHRHVLDNHIFHLLF